MAPAGRRLELELGLDALTDAALDQVAVMPGVPFERAVLVTASTVSTAPLEWLAVLLGRGTAVLHKTASAQAPAAHWMAHHAVAVGLPVTVSLDRGVVAQAPLVVVMGSDATVDEVRRTVPTGTRVLGFGHRFSVAWWQDDGDAARAAALFARDLAAHDSRGCMSPAFLLTPDPQPLLDALPRAMADAEARWPVGDAARGAVPLLRARGGLARVVGSCVAEPSWRWSVMQLGVDHAEPVALPRCAVVVPVATAQAARALLARWPGRLSSQATRVPGGPVGPDLGAPRTCDLGDLQAPRLVRAHDGVDHLRLTLR